MSASSLANKFMVLPTPVKIVIFAATGGGIIGIIKYINTAQMRWTLLAMVLVAIALIYGYRLFLKWRAKRKSNPFSQGIIDNSSAAPSAIADPGARARLDDLRTKFEDGVSKFKAAGKNLYAMPWYVLVGEPGSGKTKAIQKCNVGFPPGMQDELQGTGGTLNMHWWFTNFAVILDTAGRLMFEEVSPGETSEWKEFLTMLKKHRPNAPINGLLLVIPADTLTTDTADDIESKGGKIARQLDTIQRLLGVRFPVFVVVTKCDKINGFREFFEQMRDPQLQHQMLGWSNPADLDDPFNPELVEDHLRTVRERIERRRLGMLIDPVHTGDSMKGRRVDEVDALYSFPEGLTKLGSRLRRYLELVFVAGEWSPKPLFLRGIYFTSSVREGMALDEDLAAALGISVEALPEDHIGDRERAYFLRDLFMSKVFKEQGLVTQASNARKQQRQRRLIVLSAGSVAAALMIVLTYLGASTLEKNISGQRDFWKNTQVQLSTAPEQFTLLEQNLDGDVDYGGQGQVDLGSGTPIPTGRFPLDAMNMVKKETRIPAVYKFAAFLGDNIDTERRLAHASLFETIVLKPLLDATRDRLQTAAKNPIREPGGGDDDRTLYWDEHANAAMVELLKIEAATMIPGASDNPELDIALDPLFRYALGPASTAYQNYKANDDANLQLTFDWVYSDDAEGGQQDWPPAWLASQMETQPLVDDTMLTAMNTYWIESLGGGAGQLYYLILVKKNWGDFEAAERDIRKVNDAFVTRTPQTLTEYNTIANQRWKVSYEELAAAHTALGLSIAQVQRQLEINDPDQYAAEFESMRKSIASEGIQRYDEMMALLGGENVPEAALLASARLKSLRTSLDDARTNLRNSQNARDPNVDALTEFQKMLDPGSAGAAPYTLRFGIYKRANDELGKTDEPVDIVSLQRGLARINQDVADAETAMQNAVTQSDQGMDDEVINVGRFIVDLARRKRAYEMINSMLTSLPNTSSELAGRVEALAERDDAIQPDERPVVAFTEGMNEEGRVFDIRYHRDAAKSLFNSWALARGNISDAAGSPQVLEASALNSAMDIREPRFEEYLDDYVSYWFEDVLRESVRIREFDSWESFAKELTGRRALNINDELVKLYNLVDASTNEDVIPPSLALRIESQRNDCLEERRLLKDNRDVGDACDDTLDGWQELPNTVGEARNALLDLTPNQFKQRHLAAYEVGERRRGIPYWNEFCETAVGRLAYSTNLLASGKLNDLVKLKGYPLVRDLEGRQALTSDQVRQAGLLVDTFDQVAAAGGGLGPDRVGRRDALREGGSVGFNEIDDLLDEIREPRGIDGEDMKRIARLQILIRSLLPPEGALRCEVYMVPFSELDDPSLDAQRTFPYVIINGKEQSVDISQPVLMASLSVPGDVGFVIGFGRSTQDANPVRTVYDPEWTLIDAVTSSGAESVSGSAAAPDGRTWRVPVPIGSTGKTYMMELRFSHALPSHEDWPTRATWPGAR